MTGSRIARLPTGTRLGLAAIACSLLLGAACSDRPESKAAPAASAASGGRAALFDEARAWAHLEALVAMGPRGPGLPGHAAARRYMREQLEAVGAVVEELPLRYQGKGDAEPREFVNISGLLGERSGRWVLLGTHYDTHLRASRDRDPKRRNEPVLGANDGGSGVAVLLEIARVLSERPAPAGVEIVFFDGEDYGHLSHDDYLVGSRDMVRNWSTLRPGGWPEAVVVVDMVGDADLRIRQEPTSDPTLTGRLWRSAARLGEKAFVRERGMAILDDHSPFLDAGVPAALIIDLEYPPYHSADDTLSHCSPESLGSVGRVVLDALFDANPPPIR